MPKQWLNLYNVNISHYQKENQLLLFFSWLSKHDLDLSLSMVTELKRHDDPTNPTTLNYFWHQLLQPVIPQIGLTNYKHFTWQM